jgi:hypothetical protein
VQKSGRQFLPPVHFIDAKRFGTSELAEVRGFIDFQDPRIWNKQENSRKVV